MLVETEGLVLKSYGLSEADKIVVFLTRYRGLVRGVAKGAKRLKSRFGSSLEPFSIINLTYYQKEERELVSVQGCEIIKSFFETASNPLFFQKFSYIAELLSDFAPPSDPDERLYRMARVCLETTELEPEKLEQIVVYFELWLLKLGGYLPSWSHCGICQKDFGGEREPANLHLNFQLVCRNCQKSRSQITVSARQREIFSAVQKYSPIKFLEITEGEPENFRTVSTILKKIISHVLGRELVGEKILIANK